MLYVIKMYALLTQQLFPMLFIFLAENETIIITAIIYDRRDPSITQKRV